MVQAQPLPEWATVDPYSAGITAEAGEGQNLLSGKWTSTRLTEEIVDPLTGKPMFYVPDTSRGEVCFESVPRRCWWWSLRLRPRCDRPKRLSFLFHFIHFVSLVVCEPNRPCVSPPICFRHHAPDCTTHCATQRDTTCSAMSARPLLLSCADRRSLLSSRPSFSASLASLLRNAKERLRLFRSFSKISRPTMCANSRVDFHFQETTQARNFSMCGAER